MIKFESKVHKWSRGKGRLYLKSKRTVVMTRTLPRFCSTGEKWPSRENRGATSFYEVRKERKKQMFVKNRAQWVIISLFF